MNGNEVKKFVKEHKAKFIAGAGIAFGGVLFVIGLKTHHSLKDVPVSAVTNGIRNISVPEGFAVGKIDSLWEEKGVIDAIVDEITVSDLGALGREFVKHGLITDGAEASVIVGFLKTK